VVLGATCTRNGVVGVLAASASGWRLASPAVLPRLDIGTVRVIGLIPTGDGPVRRPGRHARTVHHGGRGMGRQRPPPVASLLAAAPRARERHVNRPSGVERSLSSSRQRPQVQRHCTSKAARAAGGSGSRHLREEPPQRPTGTMGAPTRRRERHRLVGLGAHPWGPTLEQRAGHEGRHRVRDLDVIVVRRYRRAPAGRGGRQIVREESGL